MLLGFAVLLQLSTSTGYQVPSGYKTTEPDFDHGAVGRGLAEAGKLQEALESFRAACAFTPTATAYANLGVALMRAYDFGGSYRALAQASKYDPASSHVKSNLEALYTFAKRNGYGKEQVQKMAEKAELKIAEDDGGTARQKSSEDVSVGDHGAKTIPSKARQLLSPRQLAERGRELHKRGERRLGLGFLSLALHLNPWVARDLAPWFGDLLQGIELMYWEGNIFVGHDKTLLESLASDLSRDVEEPEVYELAIYSWRNLQLTRMSCCGIDNFAVFMSKCRSFLHPYLVPFLHLTPGYAERLKPENRIMYTSFKKWWESNGERGMPDPPITLGVGEQWDWSHMRVRLPPSRAPEGWDELVQAVLLFRLGRLEQSRACAVQALGKNGDLAVVIDELLPGLEGAPVPALVTAPRPTSGEKYLVCYNPWVGLGNLAAVMVSAHALAKITGRTLVIDWNVNRVSRHAYHLRDQLGVKQIEDVPAEMGVLHSKMKHLYLFHMMDSVALRDVLELLGCSELTGSLDPYPVVTVSSNLYFAALLQNNPHVPSGTIPDFPEALASLLQPSSKAKKRALSLASKVEWGAKVPVIAVHVRAREEAEDKDDWPSADSPDTEMLEELWRCVTKAAEREFQVQEWDVFVAATTQKARQATVAVLKKNAKGLRKVIVLANLDRNRRSGSGAVDAMAEALLISRADIIVRLVVGTTGTFSTFAYLSNALRKQQQWAESLSSRPQTTAFAPNYVVTRECGPQRCFVASPRISMADVSWHGKGVTTRSCGDVIQKLGTSDRCSTLKPADDSVPPQLGEDEL